MDPLTLANPCAIPLADLPPLPAAEFDARARALLAERHRPAALAALPFPPGPERLVALLADDRRGSLALLTSPLARGERRPSLSAEHPAFHIYERLVAETHGVTFEGHPWPKPARYPHDRADRAATMETYPFYRLEGGAVHEVAVGPVHAGVIEPGHFRFSCTGERVWHLEIQLGYQHRGVEALLPGADSARRLELIQSAAGDSLVAHGTAYCLLTEALAGMDAPPRAQAVRALAQEMERAAMHLADLGALANDVAYLPAASHYGATRTLVINALLLLCGSRFGRGLLAPGGLAVDPPPEAFAAVARELETVVGDLAFISKDLFESVTVLSRFERTGRVRPADAQALGLAGFAGRASLVDRDVRRDHPYGAYRHRRPAPALQAEGAVLERALVRDAEAAASLTFCLETLADLPGGPVRAGGRPLRPGRPAMAMTEGWRGETIHLATTDDAGGIAGYRILDPSLRNWKGLELALRGEPISDFPLCNKSFNQSYCGFDL